MDGTGSAAVAERGQQGRAVPAEAAKEEDVVVQSSVFRFFGELSLDSSDGGGVDGDASSAARSGDDAQDDDHARHLRDGVIALLQTLSTTFDQGAITPATWHQLAQGLVDECKARLRGDYLEAVEETRKRLAQHVPTEAVAGEPCHNTAIVICPPSELHACIQAIRRKYDKRHVDIWPPHITLFYPFVQPSRWHEVKVRLASALQRVMPFTLNLNSFGSFNHGKRGHVTWLRPEPSSAIESLHAAMVDTLSHMGRWSRMKQPHMTVARSQPAPLTQELQQHWTPIQFEVDRVYLLQRTSSKSPMQVVGEIQLGRDSGSDDDGDGGGDSAQQEQQQRRGDDDATNSALRSLLQALNASVRRGVITRSRMVQLRRALLPPPLAVAENDRPSVEEEIEFAARVFESDGVEVQDGTTVIITVDGSDDGVQAVVDISIAFDDNHPNVTPRVTIHSAQNLTAAQQAVLALVLNTHTEHWFNTPLHPFAPEQFFVFSVFNTAAHFLRDEQSRLGTVRAVHSGGKPSVTVNNTTTNYNHLLEWRDVNTSTKQQLGTLSVRELDTLVYRALLKHMHTTLRKPTREGGRQRRYSARLTHVENVLHPTLLERYNEAVARLLDTGAVHDRSNAHADEYPEEIKTLLPRLAFHGTCERNVAESIANQGLVAPGDFDDSGRYIGMKTGALYGSGSYVSPNLLKSHWYSYQDARGHAQMLVGLAIPGRCRQFTADSISQIRRDGLEIHDLECDSHTDPSKEELILYTSDLFLPVLLIEYALTDEQVNPPSAPALKGSVEALDDVQQFAVAHLLSLPPSSSSSSPSSLSSSSMPAHGEPSAAKQQKQQKKKKHGGSADGEKGEVKGEWNKLMAALGPRTKQTLQLQLTQEHWLLELRPALFQPATMPLHGGGGGGGAHHHMVLCLARFPDIKGSMLSDLASGVELLIRQSGAHSVSVLVFDEAKNKTQCHLARMPASNALSWLSSSDFTSTFKHTSTPASTSSTSSSSSSSSPLSSSSSSPLSPSSARSRAAAKRIADRLWLRRAGVPDWVDVDDLPPRTSKAEKQRRRKARRRQLDAWERRMREEERQRRSERRRQRLETRRPGAGGDVHDDGSEGGGRKGGKRVSFVDVPVTHVYTSTAAVSAAARAVIISACGSDDGGGDGGDADDGGTDTVPTTPTATPTATPAKGHVSFAAANTPHDDDVVVVLGDDESHNAAANGGGDFTPPVSPTQQRSSSPAVAIA